MRTPSSPKSLRLGAPMLACAAFFAAPSTVRADGPLLLPALRPSPSLDLPALEHVVLAASPEVAHGLLAIELARANVWQARLPQNPSLDFTWGTIPLGNANLPANDPAARDPLGNIPNYTVGLTMPLSFWRAGARTEQAEAALEGTRSELEGTARERGLTLARALGSIAAAQLRVESTKGLASESGRAVKVAEQRLAQQFGTALEVERLRIEAERNEQQLRGAKAELARALATCAGVAGRACEPFGTPDEARAYVERWTADAAARARAPEERPDVVALTRYARAASAEAHAARLQAFPDLSVRLGYTHDRFVISGNQQNSLSISFSLTLPFFDHGQAAAAAAAAKEKRLIEARDKAIGAARAQVPSLAVALEEQRARRDAIVKSLLPRARAVVADLEKAAETHLVTLLDVIQARRMLSELGIDEAESLGGAMDAAVELELQAPTKKPNGGAP